MDELDFLAMKNLRLGLFAAFVAVAGTASAQVLHTRVTEGALSGKREGSVNVFLGVPFAAPPVGDRRWKPPMPAARWTGERAADRFSANCQQTIRPNGSGPWTAEYATSGDVGEDCLYLNVWTPAKSASERLPVLVWIHGGGFTGGSGSAAVYNGAALASKGIIVVTLNYRLGVYGFLAHPELSAESPAHASGNYALLDQIAALRWVHDNIAAFGGDPSRVTVGGQSAGAASVHHLIASPLAKGLFGRAIAQSGSGMGEDPLDHKTAEARGKELTEEAGDPLSIEGLRKLAPPELAARIRRMRPTGGARFTDCIDGLVLPNASFIGKNTNDTPILTGLSANEASGLEPGYFDITKASFSAKLTSAYGAMANDFATAYPAADDASARPAFDAQSRDRGLASMYFWARERLSTTRHRIYAYLLTHVEPGPDSARYLAFHSSELPYMFDNLDTSKRPFTAGDRRLAAEMSARWVSFVKTGDPNVKGLPTWQTLDAKRKQIMELGVRSFSRPVLRDDTLALFDRFVKGGGRLSLF